MLVCALWFWNVLEFGVHVLVCAWVWTCVDAWFDQKQARQGAVAVLVGGDSLCEGGAASITDQVLEEIERGELRQCPIAALADGLAGLGQGRDTSIANAIAKQVEHLALCQCPTGAHIGQSRYARVADLVVV